MELRVVRFHIRMAFSEPENLGDRLLEVVSETMTCISKSEKNA